MVANDCVNAIVAFISDLGVVLLFVAFIHIINIQLFRKLYSLLKIQCVKRTLYLVETLGGYVGINLRGLAAIVPQHRLYVAKIYSVFQTVCRKRISQCVHCYMFFNPCPGNNIPDHILNASCRIFIAT